MINYEMIDKILFDLVNSGSNISYFKELRDRSIAEIKKDIDLKEVLESISEEIEYLSFMFLNVKNRYDTNVISGLMTGIYLPDYSSGSFKYVLVGGDKSRTEDDKVNLYTIFDVASITKLFTLLLAFKLEELGYIDLDTKVVDINPDFKGLEDYTLNDLIKLYGEIRTNGNINDAKDEMEAYQILKTLYVKNNDRSTIKYNDFGSMVIEDTICKVISKELGQDLSFDQIMYLFLLKPLKLKNTGFNPATKNVSGNGYSNQYPHDPKARLFNGVQGHAGLFTNSSDLMYLADGLFERRFLNREHMSRLTMGNIPGAVKGNMGLYLKHPDGHLMTYTPNEFSNQSFTAQGWTGSIASFDLHNQIHNSILVNAIIDGEGEAVINNKPKSFLESFDNYQIELVKRIMLMYVVKKYYNKYCRINENIELRRVLSI